MSKAACLWVHNMIPGTAP